MRRTPFVLAATLLAFITAAPPAAARDLADHTPADAMIYIEWAGSDNMPNYENSAFKRVLEGTGMMEKLGNFFNEAMAEDEEVSELDAEILKQVFEIFRTQRWAAYTLPIDLKGKALDDIDLENAMDIVVLVDPGHDRDRIKAEMQKLVDHANNEQGDDGQLIEADGLLVMVDGPNADRFKHNPDQPLSKADHFKTLFGHKREPDTAYRLMIRTEAFMPDLLRMMEANPADPEVTGNTFEQTMPVIVRTLGFEKVQTLTYTGRLTETGWETRSSILAPDAGGLGFIKPFAAKPITEADLAIIPKTATWCRVTSFDMAGMFDTTTKAIGEASPETAAQLGFLMGMADGMLGASLQNDILKNLGPRWTLYSDPALGNIMGMFPGIVMVNQTDNGGELEAALTKVENTINQMLAAQDVPFAFNTMDMGDLKVHALSLPVFAPAWAVKDGRFFLAISPQAVTIAAQAAANENNSITQSDGFKQVMEQLGQPLKGGKATTLTYADLPRSGIGIYQSLSMILSLAESGQDEADFPGEEDIEFTKLLPPYGPIAAELRPAGAVSWIDEHGYHNHASSPFPGAMWMSHELMLMGYNMQTAPIFSVLMIPALAEARTEARATVSLSNMKQIGIGFAIYAADHKDELPESLGLLSKNQYFNDHSVFFHPAVKFDTPIAAEDMPAWIDQKSSYIYINSAKRFDDIKNHAEHAMLVERPRFATNEGLAISFADGHVERVPLDKAKPMIEKQTGKTWEEVVGDDKNPEADAPAKRPAEPEEEKSAPAAPR